MKKIFKYIPFLIITLCFTLNVEAKNVMVDYDSTEMFNYFYEEKNNTAFYRYLLSHQSNLYDTLKQEYSNLNDSVLSLFLATEFKDTSFLKQNTAYVILGKQHRTNSYKYITHVSYDDNKLTLYKIDNSTPSIRGFFNYITESVLFCYDSDSNYLGYIEMKDSELINKFQFFNSNVDYNNNTYLDMDFYIDTKADFSYFLSKVYYLSSKVTYSGGASTPDLVVNRYRLNDVVYYIDDNANYNEFLKNIIVIFTSARNAEVENSYLEFFKNYKYMTESTGANPLYTILNYKQNNQSLPSSFTSISFETNKGVLLIPKKKVNDDNSKVYMSSTGKPRLQLNFFEIKEDKTLNLLSNYKRNVTITKSNSIGYLNLYSSSKLGPLPSKNYYDYVYWISNLEQFKKNEPLKYEISLYYNPEYYDYKYIGDTLEDYTLSIFGDNYSLTKEMIEGANFSGTSVDIFADSDYQQSMAEEEGFWGKDNIIGNIDSVYGTVTNSAISMLSLVTLTFAALPVEIKTIFILSLVVGFLILLKKLISG